jgi:FKBP-type peptidyl-prolyl cis-trans isomerase SlyD
VKVTDDNIVSLEYILTLNNGDEVDRSDPGEPLEYLHGQGQIIPGLETALYGMAVGDEKSVSIQPIDGYGESDDENFVLMPLESIPDDMKMKVGDRLFLRDDSSDEDVEATVAELDEESVKFDLNHPLAGETLHFNVKIADLRPATDEELAHGHAHGHGHTH